MGVPRSSDAASHAARSLIAELRHGRRPAPDLVRLLRAELPRNPRPTPDTIEQAFEWIGKSDAARGATLRDLLRLADALPQRERPSRSSFPGVHPV